MIIGLVQYKFINCDTEFNLSQIKKAMESYAGKADMLCFGESFLQGFDAVSGKYEDDKNIALTLDSWEISRICSWSRANKMAVMFGYFEKEGEAIYSSCAVISEGKVVHNYRRTSPGWRENSWGNEHYKEGRERNTFCLKGKEFGIALCGDLWDVDWEKFKTDAVLLWPVYLSFDLEVWATEEKEYALQAAKVAKQVLMINSVTESPDSVSHGGTFYFREGEIKAKLSYDTEDVLLAEI